MSASSDSFGTSAVARILRCSVRTAAKVMDSQKLRSWRMPPTLKQRRTSAAALREYLETHGMPSDLLEAELAKGLATENTEKP